MGAPASFKPHAKHKDHISWFEIPVYDLGRAVLFYSTICDMRMEVVENGDFAMAYFPPGGDIGGALVQAKRACAPRRRNAGRGPKRGSSPDYNGFRPILQGTRPTASR